ncbi:Pro-opiomelanocortin [Camelus dromedarius]|uniref:Pro-opiomelanocortin n=1 Tax=Camelus dromedarius TaxID=9838 RepID=A0A5N4D7M8_CAMDR|nr:pro-opiomelanocortin [Camelus dromedarius]KAB1267174.1 Pro-opiomelanocortin [Camelus dromedarius]
MLRLCRSRSGALLLTLLLQASMEVRGWCLESSQCQDLTTESNLLACILRLSPTYRRRPCFPGNGDEQPLTENARSTSWATSADRFGNRTAAAAGGAGQKRERSGRRRRPRAPRDGADRPARGQALLLHYGTSAGASRGQEAAPLSVSQRRRASHRAFPLEFKRELAGERPEAALGPEAPAKGATAQAELEYGLVAEAEGAEKKDGGPYKMQHFRWGSPPKDKRYGGFMTSEKSQTPLVTLFKNAIIKNAHKKGQ